MQTMSKYLNDNYEIETRVKRKLYEKKSTEEDYYAQSSSNLNYFQNKIERLKNKHFKTKRVEARIKDMEGIIERTNRSVLNAGECVSIFNTIANDEGYMDLCEIGQKINRANIIVNTAASLSVGDLFEKEWPDFVPGVIQEFSFGPKHDVRVLPEDLENVTSLETFRKKIYEMSGLEYISLDQVIATKKKEQAGEIDSEDANMIYFISGINVSDDLKSATLTENNVIPTVVINSAIKQVEQKKSTLKKTLS